jgi:hypothetical protein
VVEPTQEDQYTPNQEQGIGKGEGPEEGSYPPYAEGRGPSRVGDEGGADKEGRMGHQIVEGGELCHRFTGYGEESGIGSANDIDP